MHPVEEYNEVELQHSVAFASAPDAEHTSATASTSTDADVIEIPFHLNLQWCRTGVEFAEIDVTLVSPIIPVFGSILSINTRLSPSFHLRVSRSRHFGGLKINSSVLVHLLA